jgi:hypothetical protein
MLAGRAMRVCFWPGSKTPKTRADLRVRIIDLVFDRHTKRPLQDEFAAAEQSQGGISCAHGAVLS